MQALAGATTALGMSAVAVADHGNLYGLVKFHRACLRAGIKPLTACELLVRPEPVNDHKLPDGALLLLVRDEIGYRNLLALVSAAHTQPIADEPGAKKRLIPEALLRKHHQGLLVLAGGEAGTIAKTLRHGQPDQARAFLERCQALWGDYFYLEIQRLGRPHEEALLGAILQLASECDAPVVATHDVCFLKPEDYDAHETRVCIQNSQILDDPNRTSNYLQSQYLQTPQEMQALFNDLPTALANSTEIAQKCNFELQTGTLHMPHFSDAGVEAEVKQLQASANEGLERLRAEALLSLGNIPWETYQKRLNLELETIKTMGFAGYFLVVMEFVRWAKEQQIPVGPGRGSGAGSLVAYALAITDLDPLRYNLLFERFLNPERHSMPDFDIDFCIDGRDKVITHVSERYGDKFSQIVTFGTMAARAVVRDVTRVQAKPYGLGDTLAKLIPFSPDMTLARAMEEEKGLGKLANEDSQAKEVLDMAFKLEGIVRNVGKHPGGVVIAPSRLTDHVAISFDEHGAVVSQFDKDDVEQVGLVKFDFLGLRTLTVIDQTVTRVNEAVQRANAAAGGDPEPLIDIAKIPLDDAQVFAMLKKGDTDTVFQLESSGMKDLIVRLQPEQFEDIVSLVALYRPGPLDSGMTDDFVKRRLKHAEIRYEHPDLEPVLKNTYGVIVYQEQVMQIAQVLAGYSLGDADILRRAMGKKQPLEMELQRDKFIKGAAANDIAARVSAPIFEVMEKFAGYGFNRSHSVGYGLIAYQTAWLKCHYPAEFMAVTLSLEMHNTDKLVSSVATCRRMGLKLLPACIGESHYRFEVVAPKIIRYGLGAIKGVGESAAKSIAQSREAEGDYKNMLDFCQRQKQQVPKRAGEALVKAGAMDVLAMAEDAPKALQQTDAGCLRPNRAALLALLALSIREAERLLQNEQAGLVDIFDEADTTTPDAVPLPVPDEPPWTTEEELQYGYETLGFYFDRHPVSAYASELAKLGTQTIGALKLVDELVTVGAMIVAVRKKRSKKGKRIAFVTLEDASGRLEVGLPSAMFAECAAFLNVQQIVIATGMIETDAHTGGMRMHVRAMRSLEDARSELEEAKSEKIASIHIDLNGERYPSDADQEALLEQLSAVLKKHSGGHCRVKLCYQNQAVRADLQLSSSWLVKPNPECLNELRTLIETSDEAQEKVRFVPYN